MACAYSVRTNPALFQHIARFKAVREDFDPNGIYRSVVGEIIGVYD